MAGINIQKKFFHLCFDNRNFKLLEHLFEVVDEKCLKNSEKIGIIIRFHYYSEEISDIIQVYDKAINLLKPNLNGTNNGQTLLTNLCCRSTRGCVTEKQFVEYLLNRKDVDINKPDRYKNFPALQYLFIFNNDLNMDLVNLLVSHGADYNICNKFGQTILHMMVKEGRVYNESAVLENTKYLLFKTNLNVGKKDNDGKTALDIIEDKIKKNKEDLANARTHQHHYYNPIPDLEKSIVVAEQLRDIIKARVIEGV